MSEPGVPRTAEPRPGEPVVPIATLAYAEASGAAAAIEFLYRVAWYCWVVPLSAGALLLVLFAATHSPLFPILGVFVLRGGGAALLVGLLCLYVFSHVAREFPIRSVSETPFPVRSLLVRLLLNIPVAIACIAGGALLM